MKMCSKCKIEKELSEFSKDKSKKDGIHVYCKKCDKELRILKKEYYKEYRDKNKEYQQDYNNEYFKTEIGKLNKKKASYNYWSTEIGKLKRKAISKVNHAIRDNRLVKPETCSLCNSTIRIQAHHHSYEPEYWLDVVFLCESCHKLEHLKLNNPC